MKPTVNFVIGLAALVLAAAGCHDGSSRDGSPSASPSASGPSGATPATTGSSAPAGSTSKTPTRLPPSEFKGAVVETMDSGGYTYIQVDTGAETIWAAANQFEVKVGDVVIVPAGMPMSNFHSNTLNRNFELIYFTGGVRKAGAVTAPSLTLGQLPGGHPPLPGSGQQAPALPGGHPGLTAGGAAGGQSSPHSKANGGAGMNVEAGSIETPSGGVTVAVVFEEKSGLAGKEVIVRGKVVKFTGGILKRNWLHLKDGTGSAGTDDLTVTTTDGAAVGDTVVVRGTVVVDKDFGAGYKYGVLVENATVTVEATAQP